MDISVIIPLYNEDESLTELTAWIEKVMTKHRFSYEIIMIDDGSKDRSWELICRLAEKNPCIRAIRFSPELRKICRPALRFSRLTRRCRHYNGRRHAGQPRRNPVIIQDDYRRRL